LSTLKDGDNTIGIRMKAKIVKNKVAPPFRTAEFDMLNHRGISIEGDVLDLAAEDRIVERSGTWYSYGETRIGQGRDKARAYLEENPQLVEEIKQKVLAARGYGATAPAEESNGQSES
jgi:recombination protein RecA